MSKEIKLVLGGKERSLLFGTMGVYRYIHTATKEDPLEWITRLANTMNNTSQEGFILRATEDMAIAIYAGLNIYLDSVDEPNIDLDTVRKWSNALSAHDAGVVIGMIFSNDEETKAEKPGEVETQAAIS